MPSRQSWIVPEAVPRCTFGTGSRKSGPQTGSEAHHGQARRQGRHHHRRRRGMGASHARRFVAEGAKVVLTDVNADGIKTLARELGQNALAIEHDVTRADGWARVVEKAESAFGNVTVLVNNAGILGPIAKTVDLAEDEYYRVCAINQHSQFLGMKAVIPSMQKARIGSIVNISSLAGLRANYGFPSLAYVASKFASRGMTKATAQEYGPENIRVNSVHPGFINTPMMVEATDEAAVRRCRTSSSSASPSRRGLVTRAVPGLRRVVLHHRGRAQDRCRDVRWVMRAGGVRGVPGAHTVSGRPRRHTGHPPAWCRSPGTRPHPEIPGYRTTVATVATAPRGASTDAGGRASRSKRR
ncbi:hypothetical protein L7F22_000050 [Adiantum nelumboides]|nr:hypothetical protein [Adiantum nelumboides]